MTERREQADLQPFLNAVAESRARMEPGRLASDPSALFIELRSAPLDNDPCLLAACFANLDLLPSHGGTVTNRVLDAVMRMASE